MSTYVTRAADLIQQSQSHDEIATAPYTEDLAAALLVECDGNVDANDTEEYWADDPDSDDGMLWRVHLVRDGAQS